jgi:hypothetical protein
MDQVVLVGWRISTTYVNLIQPRVVLLTVRKYHHITTTTTPHRVK